MIATRKLLLLGYKKRDICYVLTDKLRDFKLAVKLAHAKYKFFPNEKTRKQMSESRKKWLKLNRNKHNWRFQKEFYPEKLMREWFENIKINHIVKCEYTPEDEDFEFNYKFDFAIIDLKIDIELNGNQHYNKDGSFTTKHLIRQNYILSKGWKVINIPSLNVTKDFTNTKIKLLEIIDKNDFEKVINFTRYKYWEKT